MRLRIAKEWLEAVLACGPEPDEYTPIPKGNVMTVRAKFRVDSISTRAHWDKLKPHIGTVKLVPVMGDSPENKEFYEASPSGAIELGTINKAALDQFAIGQEFYVDFTPAQ